MATTARKIPTDPVAFLAWEDRQRQRYELIGEVVRMMTGGTLAHGRISRNLVNALSTALAGGPCEALGGDVKVVSPAGSVMYPDAFVRCGPADQDATSINDPVLVAEVRSPSTERYDLHEKRYAYQTIPTLRHLVIVDAKTRLVEVATRADGDRWMSTMLRSADDTIPLESLGVSLRVADIYAGVTFKRRPQ